MTISNAPFLGFTPFSGSSLTKDYGTYTVLWIHIIDCSHLTKSSGASGMIFKICLQRSKYNCLCLKILGPSKATLVQRTVFRGISVLICNVFYVNCFAIFYVIEQLPICGDYPLRSSTIGFLFKQVGHIQISNVGFAQANDFYSNIQVFFL